APIPGWLAERPLWQPAGAIALHRDRRHRLPRLLGGPLVAVPLPGSLARLGLGEPCLAGDVRAGRREPAARSPRARVPHPERPAPGADRLCAGAGRDDGRASGDARGLAGGVRDLDRARDRDPVVSAPLLRAAAPAGGFASPRSRRPLAPRPHAAAA